MTSLLTLTRVRRVLGIPGYTKIMANLQLMLKWGKKASTKCQIQRVHYRVTAATPSGGETSRGETNLSEITTIKGYIVKKEFQYQIMYREKKIF
ncbi:hypothetical protein Btru_020567 [Bulinus truncatus]|nr:hypothetical protein Btru_020567 [Bulinus truncatus]